MKNQTLPNNPVTQQSTQAVKKVGVIKLAIDVHAAKFKVSRQLGDLPLQPPQSFTPGDFVTFAEKQLNLAEVVYSCYEAGPTGFWLHRRLTEMGVRNLVVVPGNLDAYGRRVNDDRTDCRNLSLKLSRYVAGETEALAVVYVPSLEAEQRRALVRQRAQFGKTLRSLAAMGRSLCLLHGCRLKGPWWRTHQWADWKTKLPSWMVDHLERFRATMNEAEKQVLALTKSIRESAPKDLPVGLGSLTFEAVEREVVDWTRFKNRKQPGSFAGLCGGVSSSGEKHADLPITKHGNARLRAILVELAWRLAIFQPGYKAVARWRSILVHGHARQRKRAIVAIARRFLVDLWRWRTGRVSPEQLGWIMTSHPPIELACDPAYIKMNAARSAKA